MSFPFLGFGVGLRTKHYPYIVTHWPKEIDWFEALSENYMIDGGRPLFYLDQIRERYPVVLHGVSLNIGSTDPLNKDHLQRLKKLISRVNPPWVSDHLCWTGVGGHNLHDLVPLPYNEETIQHVVRRVKQVQDFLERPILLENVSSYMEYTSSTMPEWEFLERVSEESDCKILLDINNIYVSSINHNFNSMDYINAIPINRVVQFHLAGHSNMKTHLLDTHDHAVKKDVWDLYKKALERFGKISTMIERDDKIPPFPSLVNELSKAKKIFHQVYAASFFSTAKNRKITLEAHFSA